MQLYYTPIANYVHTVEAVINYCGLRASIHPVPTKPFDAETPLLAINPLGKVPTLVLANGEYLAGGPVIYEYFDSLHDGRRLFPTAAARRWPVLRQAWMADGLFDAIVAIIVESWHEHGAQREAYLQRCWNKITHVLDQIERDVPSYGDLDIAQLRTIGALQFLELKMAQIGREARGLDPAYNFRQGRPALAEWFLRASGAEIFHRPLLPTD
jgi:glutathione S-transferase